MTLLEIIRKFTTRRGLATPTNVMTSQDDQILQLVGLIEEVLEDLTTRRTWTDLVREAVFTSTGVEVQGKLSALAPFGFRSILPGTLFDRSSKLPLIGPMSPQDYQTQAAAIATQPLLEYRVLAGEFRLIPAPPAGRTIAFEYASSFAVQDGVDPSVFKRYFTRDEDNFLLDEALLLAGLTWMWKKEKGMAYSEDFRRYESLLVDMAGRDGTRAILSMDDSSSGMRPGVVVPASDWNV